MGVREELHPIHGLRHWVIFRWDSPTRAPCVGPQSSPLLAGQEQEGQRPVAKRQPPARAQRHSVPGSAQPRPTRSSIRFLARTEACSGPLPDGHEGTMRALLSTPSPGTVLLHSSAPYMAQNTPAAACKRFLATSQPVPIPVAGHKDGGSWDLGLCHLFPWAAQKSNHTLCEALTEATQAFYPSALAKPPPCKCAPHPWEPLGHLSLSSSSCKICNNLQHALLWGPLEKILGGDWGLIMGECPWMPRHKQGFWARRADTTPPA